MKKNIDISAAPTAEQVEMLCHAAELPIPNDSEYPEFSEEELLQFQRISEKNKTARQKQTVTLRLSPQALARAKSLGKGYTAVLSRILEHALDDKEIIKQYL